MSKHSPGCTELPSGTLGLTQEMKAPFEQSDQMVMKIRQGRPVPRHRANAKAKKPEQVTKSD